MQSIFEPLNQLTTTINTKHAYSAKLHENKDPVNDHDDDNESIKPKHEVVDESRRLKLLPLDNPYFGLHIESNKYFVGNTPVTFTDDKLIMNGITYPLTSGLFFFINNAKCS